jgi:type I restriction enzyme S subunit
MIADLKPYAEYKASSQEWLGDLPAHWSILRAKYLFHEVDERSTTGKEELLSVSHLTGVTPRSQKAVTMFLAKSNIGHKICRPDDLVINTMWAWMGALGVSRHDGIVSPAYGVYRPLSKSKILPRFADLVLRTPAYAAEYQRCSTGVNSSRLRLYPEKFLRMAVIVPPLDEQDAIVRFLAWTNGRINQAVRAKQKVIALLNEQKQAIIHRAVTRGLDTSVSLKSSGIPWLGDMPVHWEVRRLKTLCSFVTSGSRGWGRYYADSGSIFLRIGNISTNSIELRLNRITYVNPPVDAEGERTRVLPDDILLSITAQIGAVGIVPNEVGDAFVNQHTALIRLKNGTVLPRWAAYSLLSQFGKDQCRLLTNGGTKVGLTLNDVRCLVLLFPPMEEQVRIVHGIERQTQDLNNAIARLEREIDLLREYRTRLVADVVTGKLDVREAAAKLPVEELASEPGEELVDDDSEMIEDEITEPVG